MAQDMGQGIIAPEPNDNISSTGVQEMRTLAATAAAAITASSNEVLGEVDAIIAPLSDRVQNIEHIERLPDNTNLNDLDQPYSHSRSWRVAKSWGHLNAPEDARNDNAKLTQFRYSTTDAVQWWQDRFGNEWTRYQQSGEWSGWRRQADLADAPLLEAGTDLNEVLDPAPYRVSSFFPVQNSAFEDASYTLEVLRMGEQWILQRATNESFQTKYRLWTGSSFRDGNSWNMAPGSGSVLPQTPLETDGEWTSLEEEIHFLKTLGGHHEAEYIEAGRSVEGRVIPALRIGFPEYPTVLLVGGQHGNETGPREGLLRLARELLNPNNQARFDISVLIVPNMNPDGHAAWTRVNANGQDLNRDWQDFSQPETQAVLGLIESHHVIAALDAHNGGKSRHINFTNPDHPSIDETVGERAERLFDAVWESVLDAEEQPDRYPSLNLEEKFTVALASNYRIPTMILEVPAIIREGRDDRSIPPRAWMVYATSVVAHSFIETVWRERAAFIASHADESFTPPSRHIPVLEQARKAYLAISQ